VRRVTYLTAAALAIVCVATPPLSSQSPTPAQPAIRPNPPAPPAATAPATRPGDPSSTTPVSGVPVTAAPQAPVPLSMPAAQGATPTPMADTDIGMAIILLDRVQKVLDQTVSGKAGQLIIDRSLLDEARAELTQVRFTLQGERIRRTTVCD
jgi:hypothetical protein